MKESICAGGSYLINNIQSTGISFGIERLMSLSNIKIDGKPILIISINKDKEVIKLAKELRKNGIACSVFYNKVSKALEYANSKKINYAILVGGKEVKSKKFTLRDMKSGKERKLTERGLMRRLG